MTHAHLRPGIPGTPPAGASAPEPALTIREGALFRNGREHRILAGAIHYFRVHPAQWEDRIARLAAMGANTLDTYIAWNFHQPRPGEAPEFSGWRDVAHFIQLAEQAGLDVIVRPGPYICAEWDNGGFPSWVTAIPGVGLRSSDAAFTSVVGTWFDRLLPQLAPLQAGHGGPIVAVQVENEYGSYGDDRDYLRWNRQALQERGITEILFTADGGTDYFLDGGALPDTWATATLGSRGAEAIETWKRRRPGEPFFNVEFWNGWFDHWKEHHHTRDAAEAASEVRQMLERDGSVCLYMAHGGTNFGLTSGCNHDKILQPTVTSYDSDAPIAEDGTLTDKFHAMRAEFHAAAGKELPPLPAGLTTPTATVAPQTLAVRPGVGLLDFARSGRPVRSVRPLSFEQLGLDRGLVLYSATAVLPETETTIGIRDLHDRAYLWVDGAFAGVLDDATAADGVPVTGAGNPVRLEILVENQGRINYGPLLGQGKGILGGVMVGRRHVFHWEQRLVPLEELDEGRLDVLSSTGPAVEGHAIAGAGFAAAEFDLTKAADAYLALPGFGKGFAWVNGFLLGRYWEAGPQITLYIPAPLLRPGRNRITILELEHLGTELELRDQPELGSDPSPAEALPSMS
ncbi:glycoside hydrolase family 35 protein [Arthrobacter sp. H14-L1]|uniref:glycoside hydrolase family 35 protein n=1 Tax=Arthrobacter sp. H14-L1 TaxID=2996697 RepID=UPI002271F55B|nr:beta-galactosidase [Arthrobacter sp. H14-L1]MCY0904602.1 beta-galactosidase [Arthrobacter sp. H14-L1]